jgi:nucleoid-associated protein YgaU
MLDGDCDGGRVMTGTSWVAGQRARVWRAVLPLGLGVWALVFGVGTGCQKPPHVELPSPESGQFLTLEQQRQLSTEQVEAYCQMLDDYLAALRSDVVLAQKIGDSLAVVLDSLNNAHSEANREARVLERDLRDMKQQRSTASTYVTREGDTLMKLSGLFYGTAADWRKIHEANRDKIEDPGVELPAGITLTIP